jgi:ribosomal protein S18 acetylase RimI-like enzyme
VHGMRSLLPVARRHGLALAARVQGRVAGVLVATPPNAYPLPTPGGLARLRTLLGQGLSVARRWGRVFDTLYLHHPRYPHWYLATLGVDPQSQGRGVGSVLLRHWLETIDPDGVSSYLETDRARNVVFYERAGFEVVGEARVFDVPVWLMRRPAGGR